MGRSTHQARTGEDGILRHWVLDLVLGEHPISVRPFPSES